MGRAQNLDFERREGKLGPTVTPGEVFLPHFHRSESPTFVSLSLSTQCLGSFSQAFLGFLSLPITSRVERQKHRPFLLRFKRPGTGFLPIRKPSESTNYLYFCLSETMPSGAKKRRAARRKKEQEQQPPVFHHSLPGFFPFNFVSY